MPPAPAARPRRFTALLTPGYRTFLPLLFTAAALLGFPAAVRAQAPAPAPAPSTAKAAVPPGASPAAPAAPAPEKANCDVILATMGPNKIQVIKQVRDAVPGLGLAEAKMLVESAPKLIRSGVTRAEAEAVKQRVEAAGATVTIEADGTPVTAGPAAAAAAPGEGTAKCDVILTEVGLNKIAVIKGVRDSVPGMSLVTAKTLVESAPKPVKQGITRQEAAAIKRRIEAAGATVTIREGR